MDQKRALSRSSYFLISFLIVLFLVSFTLVERSFAQVALPRIFINEVMWNGSASSTADEWIELYNGGPEILDLEGFYLFDEEKGDKILEISEGQIAPNGFFLIANNDHDHQFSSGESVLSVRPDLIDSALSLSNSNLAISLHNQVGEQIDLLGDGGKPFYFDYKKSSFHRVDYDLSGSIESAWAPYQETPDSSCLQRENLDEAVECATPTPSGRPRIELLELSKTRFSNGGKISFSIDRRVYDFDDNLDHYEIIDHKTDKSWTFPVENKIVDLGFFSECPSLEFYFFDENGLFDKQEVDTLCFDFSKNVFISEVLPHPSAKDFNADGVADTDDEYFEIASNEPCEIDLEGWSVEDASGKRYYFAKEKLSFARHRAFFKSETEISLNDSSEKLTLFSPDDEVIDQVSIPSSTSKKDLSYSKWGDRWYFSLLATPAMENIIKQTGSAIDISDDKPTGAIGRSVTVEAEVIETERSTFTLQTDYGKVEVLSPDASLPEVGNNVAIEGDLAVLSPVRVFASGVTIKPLLYADQSLGNQSASQSPVEEYLVETTYTKRIKSTKKSRLISSARLRRSNSAGSQGLKNVLPVLYLSGILSFVSTVFLYELSSKKRE